MKASALLVLADGSVFKGKSAGAAGKTVGEVVFNTSITGYQEILTDPSYARQIVTFTAVHIGNVGCNQFDNESTQPWVSGVVLREISAIASNWRSEVSLRDFFVEHDIVAISDIDTRKLTRILREKGALNGCITTEVEQLDAALEMAKSCPSMVGRDLVKEVSTKVNYQWTQGSYQLSDNADTQDQSSIATHEQFNVIAYDYGLKQNILRLLIDRGCRVTVVPAQTDIKEVLALNPDGVFLSNGPGDPTACDYALSNVSQLLETEVPCFGICLGFQLLALACGAQALKMKFGHHGSNHPIGRCQHDDNLAPIMISSQNHGFMIDEQSLPSVLEVTHRSLFDGTLQGIRHKQKPVFGFQGHPEASPGPHDLANLFDAFIDLMKRYRIKT